MAASSTPCGREGRRGADRSQRTFDKVDLTAADADASRGDRTAAAPRLRARGAATRSTFAAGRIGDYHERQRPADARFADEAGVELGWRWTALDGVGTLCARAARAAYPSTVLMNAVPARVAGVERIAMVTPPAAALQSGWCWRRRKEARGHREIWRIGGAQAVAALAYRRRADRGRWTRSSAPATPMSPPPSADVFGTVGIDSLAGPSEILVVADGANDPDWIAADLLSPGRTRRLVAQSILITDDAEFARRSRGRRRAR